MTQHRDRPYFLPLLIGGAAFIILLWAYFTTLGDIAWRWTNDPQYSHGFLVPVFAAALLWLRWKRLDLHQLKPSVMGLGLICLATSVRLAGSYFHFAWLDQMSLVACIAGLVWLAGGKTAWRWAWPALAFLCFMIPLPHAYAVALSGPMQTFATEASTFALQVLGRPALAEGNVILLNDMKLGIIEACSGLRMLVVFFALSTAVALLIQKPLWERLLIAFSALPIALASNVLRITTTGVLCESFGQEQGIDFHDMMGLAMMPIGLAFLGIEIWLLNQLLVPAQRTPVMAASEVTLSRHSFNPVSAYRADTRSRREQQPPITPAPVTQAADAPAPVQAAESAIR